jgi:hypothetical protein
MQSENPLSLIDERFYKFNTSIEEQEQNVIFLISASFGKLRTRTDLQP